MKTTKNTVLITGGRAGIGFEIAKLLSGKGNIIITARNEKRLHNAVSKLENPTAIVSDVSKEADVNLLEKNGIKNFLI
ncbi:hypothetical protein BH10BAC3_BH10BAC3_26730 [soil metagenome]